MTLKILSVHGHGDSDNEYVLFQATQSGSLKGLVLADQTFAVSGRSNRHRHTYWFGDNLVQTGTMVSLWTKSGNDAWAEMKDGTPIIRLHWGLSAAVWNDAQQDMAVLLRAQIISSKKAR